MHQNQDADYSTDGSESRSSCESHEDVFLTNTVQLVETPLEPVVSSTVNRMSSSLLMIARALTKNHITKTEQVLTILLDSGSQHSYIKEDTAKSLGLKLRQPKDITTIAFGGHAQTETSYRVRIVLHNETDGRPTRLNLWTRKSITSVPYSSSPSSAEDSTVPPYNSKDRKEVDILIGMDHYWDVVEINSIAYSPLV
ncbi:hypothetical protein OSTOST_23322 [Ostertagia ostertagi]